jgi:CheY-like chemotaxis protein
MNTKQIMVIDDDSALVRALVTRCRQRGWEATGSTDGAGAVAAIARQQPDLVILDVNLPDSDGVSVCSALAASPQLAPIPVIMLSGRDDEATINRCRALGAHYVLKGGDVWSWLDPLITRLLELPSGPEVPADDAGPPRDPTILIIDDDQQFCRAVQIRLSAYGVRVIVAAGGMQGYWTALRDHPDVILCDYSMPEGRGDYVIDRLQRHSLTRDIPIFVLTGWRRGGLTDFNLQREMFGLGARRFLVKPLDFDALLEDLRPYVRLPESRARAPHALEPATIP